MADKDLLADRLRVLSKTARDRIEAAQEADIEKQTLLIQPAFEREQERVLNLMAVAASSEGARSVSLGKIDEEDAAKPISVHGEILEWLSREGVTYRVVPKDTMNDPDVLARTRWRELVVSWD